MIEALLIINSSRAGTTDADDHPLDNAPIVAIYADSDEESIAPEATAAEYNSEADSEESIAPEATAAEYNSEARSEEEPPFIDFTEGWYASPEEEFAAQVAGQTAIRFTSGVDEFKDWEAWFADDGSIEAWQYLQFPGHPWNGYYAQVHPTGYWGCVDQPPPGEEYRYEWIECDRLEHYLELVEAHLISSSMGQ
jgi:hypothetical protein